MFAPKFEKAGVLLESGNLCKVQVSLRSGGLLPRTETHQAEGLTALCANRNLLPVGWSHNHKY